MQAQLQSLESQRDRYALLQASWREEAVRLSATSTNLARAEAAIQDLLRAKARLEAILPCKEEATRLERELTDLRKQQETQKELEGLSSQKDALDGRKIRLEEEVGAARREMEDLADLEGQEAKLRDQDLELDRLGSELNSGLADRRGEFKVQELAWSEAKANLKKVKALGAKGVCPTCERPLEGQSDLLKKKYEQAAAQAEKEIADLQAWIAAQMEKIEGAARSRSSLKKAFDDLNAKKSRRSALQSDLRRLESQISETNSDLAQICQRIELLGEVRFDLQRLLQIEETLKNLALLVKECDALAVRLEDLPRLERERAALEKEKATQEGRRRDIEGQIQALGYAESDYANAKKKLAKLVPLHDRFLFLRELVLEIPALEEKKSKQQRDLNRLDKALQEQRETLEALDFDPLDHEALQKEGKALAQAEAAAQKIRLELAAEPDIQRRLAEAVAILASLEKDLAAAEVQLKTLGYSSEAHESARQRLAGAEGELERARKQVSEKRVGLGIMKSDLERLQDLARRKKEHEKTLGDVGRRLEVVDTTRGLVNGFMDQVLIRVKSEIAKAAGEILEEVSGKYSLLKIDDDFNILVEDGGEYYPISRYSGGEIDMIAVSVRVAISEYLMRFGPDGESYSFLILDEVFGSQDPEHREKMIQMLRSLEQRFPQVIAISHISDVQGQFDNTLQVVEDEFGNSRVEAL
ncbi:DNA double-strand break repair Rad50 ATPase [uncultured archaeon]|nr:DNA double-strand break repair Rad50 ATPase [uncultured archaeon]